MTQEFPRMISFTQSLELVNESETMGIQVDYIPFSEVNEAWAAADREAAKAVADSWQARAKVIRDVSREGWKPRRRCISA